MKNIKNNNHNKNLRRNKTNPNLLSQFKTISFQKEDQKIDNRIINPFPS